MNKKQRAQQEAVDTLKQWGVVDGSTVYAKVNKVSSSGMSRNVGLYLILDGKITDVSYHAAKALEWPYKEGYDGGVRVSGAGMDMLFHTVSSLSYAMGYGPLNQSQHDMHVKYGEHETDCPECRMAHGGAWEFIGLKYRQI